MSQEVLTYIKKWIPRQRIGVLAGNSVHADRAFLVEEMPEVVDWLHYRYVSHIHVAHTIDLQILCTNTSIVGACYTTFFLYQGGF